jgi:hypothetical protein
MVLPHPFVLCTATANRYDAGLGTRLEILKITPFAAPNAVGPGNHCVSHN